MTQHPWAFFLKWTASRLVAHTEHLHGTWDILCATLAKKSDRFRSCHEIIKRTSDYFSAILSVQQLNVLPQGTPYNTKLISLYKKITSWAQNFRQPLKTLNPSHSRLEWRHCNIGQEKIASEFRQSIVSWPFDGQQRSLTLIDVTRTSCDEFSALRACLRFWA